MYHFHQISGRAELDRVMAVGENCVFIWAFTHSNTHTHTGPEEVTQIGTKTQTEAETLYY